MASKAASELILIGGGTGFVGRHLVQCLRSCGANVRLITRKPQKHPHSVSWKQIEREGLPKGTTSVVNLSGRNVLESIVWTQAYKDEVHSSRISTTKLLAEAINNASEKPKSFLTVSGVGFYEPRRDNFVYDESWVANGPPKSYPAKLVADWEAASKLSGDAESKTRRVIIRSGVVLGADGGMIQKLLIPFWAGVGAKSGDGKQMFPWIHVDDLTRMFKFAMLNNKVTGVINGVAPQQVTNEEFSNQFAAAMNTKCRLQLFEVLIKMIYGKDRSVFFLEGQKVSSRAIELGFEFEYPTLELALNQCVKEAKKALPLPFK